MYVWYIYCACKKVLWINRIVNEMLNIELKEKEGIFPPLAPKYKINIRVTR